MNKFMTQMTIKIRSKNSAQNKSRSEKTKLFVLQPHLRHLMKISFFIFTALSITSPIFSANGQSTVDTQIRQQVPTAPKPAPEVPWLPIVVGMLTTAAAGFALVTNILEYRITQAKAEAEAKLNAGLFSSEETNSNEKRNGIIIVGIGGSGKTTLIRQLFDENTANPRIANNYYKLFTIDEKAQNTKYNYFVADCAGQNMGTLITGLMLEQKRLNSPMTYGAINSIIIVVDIAKAPEIAESLTSDQVTANLKSRVEEHLTEWSNTALDFIFGLTGSSKNGLRYVCLFINKIDLLQGSPEEIRKIVIEAYQPLIKKIAGQTHQNFILNNY